MVNPLSWICLKVEIDKFDTFCQRVVFKVFWHLIKSYSFSLQSENFLPHKFRKMIFSRCSVDSFCLLRLYNWVRRGQPYGSLKTSTLLDLSTFKDLMILWSFSLWSYGFCSLWLSDLDLHTSEDVIAYDLVLCVLLTSSHFLRSYQHFLRLNDY